MSNLEEGTDLDALVAKPLSSPLLLEPRRVKLTTRSGVTIERTLPHKELKRIGAWCFLDSYGPTSEAGAMQVGAHPHTGLQTVTWLFSGTVLHHDSIGSKSTIRPGELNLMTAGRGIAHSEISLDGAEPLQGVQLWVALPESARNQEPEFSHYQDLPSLTHEGLEITLFMGELLGRASPATIHSPLVGAQISLRVGTFSLPLKSDWEYGFLVVSESVTIEGTKVDKDQLFYLPPGRESVEMTAQGTSTLILIGGAPFREQFVMWWNFIGRSHEEIVEMRKDWEKNPNRFPSFVDTIGVRIPAPEMPNLRLTPR